MISKETLDTISKYGFASVAAVALSWVTYQFLVLPANDQAQSETNKSLADSYAKMTTSNEATVTILRDIRDDTRKFPAVREANAKPEQP